MSNFSIKLLNKIKKCGWEIIEANEDIDNTLQLTRSGTGNVIYIYGSGIKINATLNENDFEMLNLLRKELKEWIVCI